jgi:hypothetical protein
MSGTKAMILGATGKSLSPDEIAFYGDEQPWGFILFARNIGEPNQIRDLVAAMRDSVGRADAPVFIDQEGGKVQRLRPIIRARKVSARSFSPTAKRAFAPHGFSPAFMPSISPGSALPPTACRFSMCLWKVPTT